MILLGNHRKQYAINTPPAGSTPRTQLAQFDPESMSSKSLCCILSMFASTISADFAVPIVGHTVHPDGGAGSVSAASGRSPIPASRSGTDASSLHRPLPNSEYRPGFVQWCPADPMRRLFS